MLFIFPFTVNSHFPPSSVDSFVEFCPVSKPLHECQASRREANCTGIRGKGARTVMYLVLDTRNEAGEGGMMYGVISVWSDGNGKA